MISYIGERGKDIALKKRVRNGYIVKQQIPTRREVSIAPQQQPRRSLTIQQARLKPGLLTPADVLQLQGTLGNHAMCQLISCEHSTPVIQRHEGREEFHYPHKAKEHKDKYDQWLHQQLEGGPELRQATRQQKTNINWSGCLLDEPGDYTEAAQDLVFNKFSVEWSGGKVVGQINYKGITSKGRNLGVEACITFEMSSQYKDEYKKPLGQGAQGGIPYFKPNCDLRGIHRGHLLARCLGGTGTIINWVPLSGSSNVSTMWHQVEKLAFEWLRMRGSWLNLSIQPVYTDESGPIPIAIDYTITFYMRGNLIGKIGRRIKNDISNNDLFFFQRQKWKP